MLVHRHLDIYIYIYIYPLINIGYGRILQREHYLFNECGDVKPEMSGFWIIYSQYAWQKLIVFNHTFYKILKNFNINSPIADCTNLWRRGDLVKSTISKTIPTRLAIISLRSCGFGLMGLHEVEGISATIFFMWTVWKCFFLSWKLIFFIQCSRA